MGERGPYCREGAKRVLKSTETQDKLGCRGGPSRERVRPRRPSDSPEIQVEEIAFEVLDTERLAHATDKVEKFAKRGVRRLFAVRVASRKVYEWDHAHHDWTELDAGAEITDRCFRVPVPVAALVDRVLADDTIARSLLASRNRVIERALADREARGEARGELRSLAGAVLRVLARKGVSVDDEARARVLDCDDRATLEAWLDRAVTATTVGDVFG